MLIFDFFAGTGSATKAFEDCGHRVIKIELDERFEAQERDLLSLTSTQLVLKYGKPDFVWASPPCTAFSVAAIGRNWNKNLTPKTNKAIEGLKLVDYTIQLINELQPSKGWVIENPRGMLRKLRLSEVIRHTVTYCQYGDSRMKPTDLWTNLVGWMPKPACKNGDACHEAAPRGSRTGTQGLKNAMIRSMIPIDLSRDLHHSICNTPKEYA